jgi:hypothetical protein
VSATQVATTTNTLPYIDTYKEGPMTKHPYINSGASAAEEVIMDHYHEDTELVRAGSSPTNQSDDELDRAGPTAQEQLDDNTDLVRTGSTPANLSDDELGRAGPRLRLELLASIFAAEPVQLKDIEAPPACLHFPDQTSDIFFTYIHCTVFNVKVWINFDAHENVFFEGARSSACGKLRLPGRVYRDFEHPKASALNFQHVCFEVVTPFRTLATVDLIAEHDGATPQVRTELTLVHADKRRLNSYLKRACQQIEYNGLIGDVDGLTFQELQDIAHLFRRNREVSPGRNEDWEDPQYGGGEWAGVEDTYKVRSGFTSFLYS